MRKLIHLVTVLALAILLEGCATKPLTKTARSSIDLVSISDSVTVTPYRATQYGPLIISHSSARFINGRLDGRFLKPGSCAVCDPILASESVPDKQYELFLKAVGIDVAPIVRGEFEAQLQQHSFFGPRLAKTAKYRFEIEILSYYLNQIRTFSDYYKAGLHLKVKLIGPNEEVIAVATGSSCIFNDCFPTNKLSDIFAKPELLRDQYTFAARDAIQELLKSLDEN